MKARAASKPTRWDEKPYEELPQNRKLTRAAVEYAFQGEMEGTGTVEYLMFYRHADAADPHNSSAVYVGLIRFSGSVNGRSGSFVMEERGTFDAGAARSTLTILQGSGTDGLAGIAGGGLTTATPASAEWILEYDLHADAQR